MNKPLLQAISSAALARMQECLPQDVANISWSFAKISFIDATFMYALAATALSKIREFNPQDLANTAWAVANIQLRDDPLMASISEEARSKIGEFEGSDFSSTAWAFSAMRLPHEPLGDAISREVLRKLHSLGAQQLGTLADLDLPCQDAIRLRLREVLTSFLAEVPSSLEGFRSGVYGRLVEDFELDNFGSFGGRFLLDSVGIQEGPSEFAERAARLVVAHQEEHASTWWRSDGLLHQRVVSYAEFCLEPPARLNERPLQGHRFQQNGYHGTRSGPGWLCATPLPINHLVDRSLCSENQLLSGICEELAGARTAGSAVERLRGAQGWLHLFVTGAPCLSCVGAMRQFSLLLPGVEFRVTIGEELRYNALA